MLQEGAHCDLLLNDTVGLAPCALLLVEAALTHHAAHHHDGAEGGRDRSCSRAGAL